MKKKVLAYLLAMSVLGGAIAPRVRATGGDVAAEEREVVVVRHLFNGICYTGVDLSIGASNGVYATDDPIIRKELDDAGFARAQYSPLHLEGYAYTDALREFVLSIKEGALWDKNSPYYGDVNRMNSDECLANSKNAKASSANSSVLAKFKTSSLNYDNIRAEALSAIGGYPVDEHYINSRFGDISEIEFVEDNVELQDDCVVVLNIMDWYSLVHGVDIEDEE